jgi:hypothetical protein
MTFLETRGERRRFLRRLTLPEAAASKSKNLGHVDCLPRSPAVVQL